MNLINAKVPSNQFLQLNFNKNQPKILTSSIKKIFNKNQVHKVKINTNPII
jgi:hypothetical protein